MQIGSAEFITSAAKPTQFLSRPIPHFAFVGRSNVGKSSLLNKLLNRKSLAKTSGSPGKTRLINYFLINDRFYFVDLPGYGFARVSKAERKKWGHLIETYLTETPYLALIFQLLDIRHLPSEQDKQMIEWLKHSQLPFLLLLTKADKLSKAKVQKQINLIAKHLNVAPSDMIATSASSGLGHREVWTVIKQAHEQTIAQITG